jgi:hypothetical protein
MSSVPQPVANPPAANPRWMSWVGWIISLVPAGMLLMSGVMKFMPMPPDFAAGIKHLGWDPGSLIGLGMLEITCVVVYLIPRSAVLGAILLTGYLGGAFATHARVGDPLLPALLVPTALGVLAWLGLLLRDARVRSLLPLRKDPNPVRLILQIPLALAGITWALVIAVFMQPTEFRVERSTTIAAAPSEVFAHVNDFHRWDDWSPWLKLDPNAKVAHEGPPAGTGAVFKWSGNDNVGEGSMTIVESQPGERIKIKLEFLKPLAGTANSEFTFRPEGAAPRSRGP